jgi:crossover junction endodeoxyribonuclease RuvC
MIVLGADPGTVKFGWAAIDTETMEAVDLGVILPPKKQAKQFRLKYIALALKGIFEKIRPDEAAVEDQFIGNNARSGIAIGTAKGVFTAIAALHGIEVSEYPATTVKKEATRKGGATKDAVTRAMQAFFHLPSTPDEDAADALAVALAHWRLSNA